MHAAEDTTGGQTAAAGDRDHAWFRDAYPDLHRVACVVAPPDVAADDLLQDALVRFLKRRRQIDIPEPLAYLTTTIVHLASNERRSWSRRQRAASKLAAPASGRDAYPSDLSDLDALSPTERAVLYLHDVLGFSFDDVGRRTGLTAAAARQAASRARRRLRTRLEEETVR